MKKLKIGVIGTGVMGLGHCDSCQKLDEVELTAVCDIDEAVVGGVAHHYKVKSFTDYKKLIDSGDVEAVIVATPPLFSSANWNLRIEKRIAPAQRKANWRYSERC